MFLNMNLGHRKHLAISHKITDRFANLVNFKGSKEKRQHLWSVPLYWPQDAPCNSSSLLRISRISHIGIHALYTFGYIGVLLQT